MVYQGSSIVDVTPSGLALSEAEQALLRGDLIVTAHPQRCLVVMPQARWAEVCVQLQGLSSLRAGSGAVRRLMMGNAHQLQCDATGRLPIPKELRFFAGLNGARAAVVGLGTHFEIWPEARWKEQLDVPMDCGAIEGLPL